MIAPRTAIVVAFATVVVSAAAPTPAAGDPTPPALDPAARKHLTAGLERYSAGDYAAASRELEAAYAIDPNPTLLYAWAQSERRGDHCEHALDLYHRYLATQPSAAQVEAANAGITECQAAHPPTATPPEPAPALQPTPAPQPAAAPWYQDGNVDALAGGAAFCVIIGVASLVGASDAVNRAQNAPTLEVAHGDIEDATSYRRFAAVTLIAGAALVAGGVYLLELHGHAAYVATDGHAVALGGRF